MNACRLSRVQRADHSARCAACRGRFQLRARLDGGLRVQRCVTILALWWTKREENDRAWKLPVKDLISYNPDGTLNSVNLDRKNPRAKEDITHLPPAQLAADILKKEQRIAEIMGNIQKLLAKS